MYNVFLLSEVKRSIKGRDFNELPFDIFRDLKCCVQRIVKGYCFRDIWNINSWFLNVIPDMLDELRSTAHGFPSRFETPDNDTEKGAEMWDDVLSRMAFLFREANEETCQKKNPYAEKYGKIHSRYFDVFGFNGRWMRKKNGERVFINDLSDFPKYKPLVENYRKTEREIWEYRDRCRKEALAMFTEYFWDLWD